MSGSGVELTRVLRNLQVTAVRHTPEDGRVTLVGPVDGPGPGSRSRTAVAGSWAMTFREFWRLRSGVPRLGHRCRMRRAPASVWPSPGGWWKRAAAASRWKIMGLGAASRCSCLSLPESTESKHPGHLGPNLAFRLNMALRPVITTQPNVRDV